MRWIELFPPKTLAQVDRFPDVLGALAPRADAISISVGLGREEGSLKAVGEASTFGATMGHVTCVGKSKEAAVSHALRLRDAGATSLMVLRGEMPTANADPSWTHAYLPHPEGFQQTSDLVRAVIDLGLPVAVSAHPEGHPLSLAGQDLEILARKADAGATIAICQFSFDPGAVERLAEGAMARGIDVQIIPAVIPVFPALPFMANRCGVPLPERIRAAVGAGDDEAADILAGQMTELRRRGFNDVYLFTLNRSEVVLGALQRL